MKGSKIKGFAGRSFLFMGSLILITISTSTNVYSQEHPPRPVIVTVSLVQNLSFGAFCQGNSGGTVIIYPDGLRSSTGDVILLNLGYSFSSGLFDVTANPGTRITLLPSPDAILTSSSGKTMTLQIGTSDPVSPFIITTNPPSSTELRIGGTLIVGTPLANPPGNYIGSFNITLIQE